MRIARQELKTTSLLVLSSDSPSIVNIADYLNTFDGSITHAASTFMAQTALEMDKPDALLVVEPDSNTLLWFADLKHRSPMRAVTVLVADNGGDNGDEFDLIIPLDSLSHLELWLRPYLKLRQHLTQVESHHRQIKREHDRLKQELSIRQQSPIDLTLLKNSIVHSVSHELRTPLLQVKSAVALLAEDGGPNQKIVELALEATTRLEAGVRNVTMLNELMNESLDTQSFSPVELGQIIQSAIRNLRRSWEHKHDAGRIQVTVSELAPVWGDRQRLVIAIQLLLDNALKFSETDVEISAMIEGDYLNIAVRDQGIGIPAEHLSHIFEPFYQVDGSSTRRYGGMGIGLAIVRFILDYHQTQIQVTTSPGKGSTFSFRLTFMPDHFTSH